MKDRNENVLTGSTSVIERWTENFEKIMNEENVGEHIGEEMGDTLVEVFRRESLTSSWGVRRCLRNGEVFWCLFLRTKETWKPQRT